MFAIKRIMAVLFLGLLLAVMLVYVPKVYAQEAPKEFVDEAFVFIRDVFGLDVASYDVRLGSYSQREFLGFYRKRVWVSSLSLMKVDLKLTAIL